MYYQTESCKSAMKKIFNAIVILLIASVYIACNSKASQMETTTKHIVINEEADDPSVHSTSQQSNYKTVKDWLYALCDKEKPKKAIQMYNFGLFEVDGSYTIAVFGRNQYSNGTESGPAIEHQSPNMFFPLPQSEYNDLSRKQVIDKVTAEIKDFTDTDKFKNSFFAKAASITTTFEEEIWTKN
jgi:hypothetical protein